MLPRQVSAGSTSPVRRHTVVGSARHTVVSAGSAGSLCVGSKDRSKQVYLSRLFELEDHVEVRGYGTGVVKFKGGTHFAAGFFIGVELDKALGKHDGFYDGKRYFYARPMSAVFVRRSRLTRIPSPSPKEESQRFSITINSGLLTINAELNKPPLEQDEKCCLEQSTYSPPDLLISDDVKRPCLSAKLEKKFTSTWATDRKTSKIELLVQVLQKELRRIKEQESTPNRTPRNRSRQSFKLRSSSPDGENEYSIDRSSLEDTQFSGEGLRSSCSLLQKAPGSEYGSTDSSSDEITDARVSNLMQEVERERLLVKKKENRVKELEDELRQYDMDLTDKSKLLTRKSKEIERLEKDYKVLMGHKKTAEDTRDFWEFEGQRLRDDSLMRGR